MEFTDKISFGAKLLSLSLKQKNATQTLCRSAEPNLVTTNRESVHDFAHVQDNYLILYYVQALSLIRSNLPQRIDQAVEVCSGPGLFSQYLHQYCQFKKVLGLDLSQPLLDVANHYTSSEVI